MWIFLSFISHPLYFIEKSDFSQSLLCPHPKTPHWTEIFNLKVDFDFDSCSLNWLNVKNTVLLGGLSAASTSLTAVSSPECAETCWYWDRRKFYEKVVVFSQLASPKCCQDKAPHSHALAVCLHKVSKISSGWGTGAFPFPPADPSQPNHSSLKLFLIPKAIQMMTSWLWEQSHTGHLLRQLRKSQDSPPKHCQHWEHPGAAAGSTSCCVWAHMACSPLCPQRCQPLFFSNGICFLIFFLLFRHFRSSSPKPVPPKAMGGAPLALFNEVGAAHPLSHPQPGHFKSKIAGQGWYFSAMLDFRNAGTSLLYYCVGKVYGSVWGKGGFSPPITGTCFCPTNSRSESASRAKWSEGKTAGDKVFKKVSVDGNVPHFSSEVCSSDQD